VHEVEQLAALVARLMHRVQAVTQAREYAREDQVQSF
jgi:hypothetical protein